MSAAPRTRERWRGTDETGFLLPKLFFFWCFFNALVSVSASSSSVSWKPLATTALARTRSPRRRDPGSNPGPRRRDDTPSRLVHVSCGLTHLDRFDAARPRPSAGRRVDASPRTRDAARRRFRRPLASAPLARATRRVLLANNPETERTIAHHRSFHRPRPFLSSASGRSSFRGRRRRIRNKSIRGASPRVSFAAAASRLRLRPRLATPRLAGSSSSSVRSYFSSSSSRRRRARSSIHRRAAPSRPSSGVQVPNPVHLSATSKKEKKRRPTAYVYAVGRESRAPGGDVGFRNNREEPVAALVRAPTRRVDRDRGAGMQKYPAPDDVTRATARPGRHP